jgi:hypothetical protein
MATPTRWPHRCVAYLGPEEYDAVRRLARESDLAGTRLSTQLRVLIREALRARRAIGGRPSRGRDRR